MSLVASLYEATKVQALTPTSVGRIAKLMGRLCIRDERIWIANSRVMFPFQARMNLPWLLGLLGMRAICSGGITVNDNTIPLCAIREGMLDLTSVTTTNNGLMISHPDDTDEVSTLVSFTRCPYCLGSLTFESADNCPSVNMGHIVGTP